MVEVDTFGASVKPRMPLSCCSAARLIAPLTSSLLVAFARQQLEMMRPRRSARRHAGCAVELAVEFRQNEADSGFRSAGRGRDHVQRGGVKVLVIGVERRCGRCRNGSWS